MLANKLHTFLANQLDLIDLFLILYKNKKMEIVRLINDTWQLIDSETESVVIQGTWDECFDKLAELERENENESYRDFLLLSGF
jgi:hypothetical protein